MSLLPPCSCTQDKSAPLCTKQRGHACTERLHALFDPYLLRRNKASTRLITVATTRINAASDGSGDGMATGAPTEASDTAAEPDTPALPGKTDLVVWLQLHPVQKQAYQVQSRYRFYITACNTCLHVRAARASVATTPRKAQPETWIMCFNWGLYRDSLGPRRCKQCSIKPHLRWRRSQY